jgi:hypothetical protein
LVSRPIIRSAKEAWPAGHEGTLWDFREALITFSAFERLDQAIKNAGFIPMGEQIVDASLVAAPRGRNTAEEKAAIEAGKTANEIWPDHPAKATQNDTDAPWTVKTSKGKVKTDGTVQSDLAIPKFGYKTHVSIDVAHGFIRRQEVTDAADHDGARLREGLVDAKRLDRQLQRRGSPRRPAASGWGPISGRMPRSTLVPQPRRGPPDHRALAPGLQRD